MLMFQTLKAIEVVTPRQLLFRHVQVNKASRFVEIAVVFGIHHADADNCNCHTTCMTFRGAGTSTSF